MPHDEFPNCLGQENDAQCIHYRDQSLESVLDAILNTPEVGTPSLDLTSDDIVTKSLVRNPAHVCSSQIVSRSFTYTVTATQSSSSFSWDMSELITNLPKDFEVGVVRVRAIAQKSPTSILADSRSPASSFSIGLDRYPVTIDFLVRILSPCGNIDMETSFLLASPTNTGTFGLTLSAKDLNPGSGSGLTLTSQLDALESRTSSVEGKLNTFETIDVKGVKTNIKTAVISNQTDLASVQALVNVPDDFQINYTGDNGSSLKDKLTNIITSLFSEIEDLKKDLAVKDSEISNLQTKIDSLNSLA